jgi:hypothetical protein
MRSASSRLLNYTLEALHVILKWDQSHNDSASSQSVANFFEKEGGLQALNDLVGANHAFEIYSMAADMLSKYFSNSLQDEEVMNYFFE